VLGYEHVTAHFKILSNFWVFVIIFSENTFQVMEGQENLTTGKHMEKHKEFHLDPHERFPW
jgi:hypothetical protein